MSEKNSNSENKNWWSVEDIIKKYPTLGIPHFQRGSVWSDENIAALLESLYYNTPCGSIVLWPNDQQDNGKLFPLRRNPDTQENSERRFCSLVIDGQQRIRSLYSVFKSETAETTFAPEEDGQGSNNSGSDADGDTTIPYVWAINLLVALADKLEDLNIKEKSQPRYRNLFAKIQDPELRKAKSKGYPYQYDFFPLKYIEEDDFDIRFADEEPETLTSSNKKACIFVDIKSSEAREKARTAIKNAIKDVQKRLKNLKTKEAFAVCNLNKDNKLEDVIHTFIRINSGGRPVQSEEKAFSRLVQLCPREQGPNCETGLDGTADYVKNIFDSIQKVEGRLANQSGDREDLQRLQERQFGFRLFIRVFILAMNYHIGKAIGTTGLSFSGIQEESRRLTGKSEKDRTQKIRELWTITARVVIAIRRLLMDQLHLDTLAFLPDSRSLLPAFMLLIKHPGFMEGEGEDCKIKDDYQMHFAYILLTVLLAATGENESEIMKLTTLLREVPLTGEKTLRLLMYEDSDAVDGRGDNDSGILNSCPKKLEDSPARKRCETLQKKWGNIVDNAKFKGENDSPQYAHSLNNRLQYANSLNNRYVLLLYALERHLQVCDFYGASLPKRQEDETKRWSRYEQYVDDLLISENSCPEKQHIVPYSAFKHSDGGKGRVVNSPANNIGNITYISQAQNRDALGCRWLWLSALSEDQRLSTGHIISPDAVESFYAIGEKDGDKRERADIDKSRVDQVEDKNDFALSPDNEHYQDWLKKRRINIGEKFDSWRTELQDAAKKIKTEIIVPHAPAIFVEESEKATDCAFLPKLWSLECGDDVKQLASWLAWAVGSAIEGQTLSYRPNNNAKTTDHVDLTMDDALKQLQEKLPDFSEAKIE